MIIGILGGGQLARMIALAGIPLGLRFVFLDPAPDACAASLGEHLCGAYDDQKLLQQLSDRVDVVTYEFENVPASSVEYLTQKISVYPAANALAIARDRIKEKSLFNELEIPTVPFFPIDSKHDLETAIKTMGLPVILKTRTLGYDGKGQVLIRQQQDIASAWDQLGGVGLIVEGFAQFKREVSVIGVRAKGGETRFYPLSENTHVNGVLHIAKSLPNDPKQSQAEIYANKLMNHLDYVGVMALELFDTGDALLANEMAPRVHNSGHWTIEGADTSQFANHLRATLGYPLGSTQAKGFATMVNFLGEMPESSDFLSNPNHYLHDYDKKPITGRKVGHGVYWSLFEHNEADLDSRFF